MEKGTRYITSLLLTLLFTLQAYRIGYASGMTGYKDTAGVVHKATDRVNKRFWLINGTLAGILVTYGLINWWKHPSKKITFTDEHWFASYSTNGGADKTGHAFSTYAISRILSHVYRSIGIKDEDADWQGPLVGLSLMTLVEFGDAFSQYNFSVSDLAADSAGALLAYLEERYPALDDLIDFRIEYLPTEGFLRSGEIGFDTDYSGMKHLLVFKFSGINSLKDSVLSYVELHAGYFTRGYSVYDKDYYDRTSRHIYAAVSINLSRIFESASRRSDRYRKPLHLTSRLLEYYQPPGLYLDCVKTFK
jgi:hypothetical protein